MSIDSCCPLCGSADRTQKVSAIVAGQTQTIRGTGLENGIALNATGTVAYDTISTVSYNGTQQSSLAQRLSPPRQPSAGTNSHGTVLIIVAILLLAGIVSLCGSVDLIIFPIILLLMGAFVAFLVPMPTANIVINLIGVLMGVIVVGIPILLIIAVAWWLISKYSKSVAEYKRRVEQVQTKEMPRWQRAMQRWNQLYYCARDDVVFLPHSESASSVSQLATLLYEAD